MTGTVRFLSTDPRPPVPWSLERRVGRSGVGLVPTGYFEVGPRPLAVARLDTSVVTPVEDRLGWVRHQLEIMVDTRLGAELTIGGTIHYTRLADEEARLLGRLATSSQ
jgi:hypothetical protein